MAFVPPIFSKFGKTCSDLLNKKWEADDFNNTISVKSSSKGVKVTSKAIQTAPNAYNGKVSFEYNDKSFGKVTADVETDKQFKGTTEFNALYPGLVVKSVVKSSSGKAVSPEASIEYVTEPVALTATHNSKGQTVTAAFGYEGFSCGVGLTKSSNADQPLAYEAGLQYEDGSVVLTANVKKDYTVGLSLYHRVSSIFQVGASGVIASDAKKSTISVGSQYAVSPACIVKGKVVVDGEKQTTAYGYVEHRLTDPNVVVGFSGSYQPTTKDAKFGFSFAFGEN